MTHVEDGAARTPAQPIPRSERRAGAQWLATRSAGEMLALAALALSALALIVVLDDGDAPGSLRDQAVLFLARLEAQANLATACALAGGLMLAAVLAFAIRARADALAQADRLARALAAARQQAERLHATLSARDEMLLAVVHELRTPLTHVVGYTELLSRGTRPRRPDEIEEMSAAIQGASATMLRLMDDLVGAAHAQAEGFSLKTRPVDLAHLIRGVVAAYGAQSVAHQVTLDVPDHWLAVRADPERIHQVLGNLLSNAVSYSPNGGAIQVGARQSGDRVRVEIEDQGIGMDAEDQRRAFERFYRAGRGRAVREHGSGLGLAIVKDLVEAHGGEVGVTSQPGVGSTFWFTLQAADDRALVPETRPATSRRSPIARSA